MWKSYSERGKWKKLHRCYFQQDGGEKYCVDSQLCIHLSAESCCCLWNECMPPCTNKCVLAKSTSEGQKLDPCLLKKRKMWTGGWQKTLLINPGAKSEVGGLLGKWSRKATLAGSTVIRLAPGSTEVFPETANEKSFNWAGFAAEPSPPQNCWWGKRKPLKEKPGTTLTRRF